MKYTLSEKKGFTLIETVITIGIFGLMMVAVTVLFRDIFVNSRQQILSLSNVDQARTVEARFVNEIRNANYAADGSYPITTASDTQIVFYTSYGSPAGTQILYRIRYYVSGTTLYRGVTTPSGNPLTYTLSTEKISAVQNDVTNGSSPCLYYYDGSYSGSSSPLSQPVNLNMVKFVQMQLTVLKQNIPGSTDTFTIKAGGALRNLKTNLGN